MCVCVCVCVPYINWVELYVWVPTLYVQASFWGSCAGYSYGDRIVVNTAFLNLFLLKGGN